MIKAIVSIERMLNKDSRAERFIFEASLIKYPAETEMNYVQLARFVFVQSLKIYLIVIFSSCFSIFRIVFIVYPYRKINQYYQSFKNLKFKTKKYEYTNC
jgi:hypothetical protein